MLQLVLRWTGELFFLYCKLRWKIIHQNEKFSYFEMFIFSAVRNNCNEEDLGPDDG